MNKQVTVGSFEVVSLPELGLTDVVAKIDTGAFSGAVHCTDIKLVKKGIMHKPTLTFNPAGDTSLTYKTNQYSRKRVRSSTGHLVTRYLIKTTVSIQGITYDIEIGLSDRSDLKKQVLIGRRFLREQQMLVDVNQNLRYDDEGEMK